MSRLRAFLSSRDDAHLREVHSHWMGRRTRPIPREVLVEEIARSMTDPERVAARVRDLGRRLTEILFLFLGDRQFVRTVSELRRTNPLSRLSPAEFEATLQALERRGFLFPVLSRRFRDFDEVARAVPPEMGEILLDLRRRSERGPLDLLSRSGFAEKPGPARGKPRAKGVEAIEAPLKGLVEEVVRRCGGLAPRSIFERLDLAPGGWDAPRWKRALERAGIGTVVPLDLSRYGIRLSEPTFVVFREEAQALLQSRLEASPEPASEASCGVDLVGNLSRFLASVPSETIRTTAGGEVFRTTRRRLAEMLVALPTREVGSEEALDLLLRFALARRLVDRTGERTFALSSAGRAFGALGVVEKTKRLLESVVEDRTLPGSPFHQFPLRRTFLRRLREVGRGKWIEAMALPFLVRNEYLASLEDSTLDEASVAAHGLLEDLQQLAWNLFAWVRRRLHLLGVVDFGYDGSGRPVAIRLSPFGARVIGAPQGASPESAGHLVVNPDFEIVLFPGEGGDAELFHDLDRFADRLKRDALVHYRLTPESVRRGCEAGLTAPRMIAALRDHSRVELPQNVLFSIRSWCEGAGTVRLRKGTLVRSERPDALDRFLQDPRVAGFVRERLSPTAALLGGGIPFPRLRRLLDELGLVVEADGSPE